MGPLNGIRVVDLTAMVSGPVAATMLADQGADVIKVEPIHGEQMRFMGAPHNGVPATFFSCNRGKRSIALDLKSDEGKDVLRDLVRQADVLIENFRPGAIDRMGFGEAALRALKPDIIAVSINGFGEKGPYAQSRVYDPVIQALSGATDIQADRTTGKPAMFRIIIADKVAALTAAQAIASALFHRERTGEGQSIKVSMLDAMISFFWPEGMGGLVYAEREFDVRKEQGTMDLIFATQDGHITAGTVSDKEWAGLCRALRREDLIDDERFATSMARIVNADVRKKIVADAVSEWPSAEILARFQAEGVPSAPLLNRSELLDNAQVLANGTISRTEYAGFGEVRQPVPPARFSKTPSEISGPAPRLGEHGRSILAELGYGEARQQAMIDGKTVRIPRD